MGIGAVILGLVISATFGCCCEASYVIIRPRNCSIHLRSRPAVEYNLCALDGDVIIAVSEGKVVKTMLARSSKRQRSVQLNLFGIIEQPKANPLETKCKANSTVCYIIARKRAASCFLLYHPSVCDHQQAYSFGVNEWDVKVRSKFRPNVPELVFNTTGPMCNHCHNTLQQMGKVDDSTRLRTIVKLYCDERYNEKDVFNEVEFSNDSTGILTIKMYTKQACLAYKSPKPKCVEGSHVVCPFQCTTTLNDTYRIDKIQPKKFTKFGATYFFRLCHGMWNSNFPPSQCDRNDTIICESIGGFHRLVASFEDDVRIELIPNGFVWHIYPKRYRGVESKEKAVISFYCDELMKYHRFGLLHLPGPSETLSFYIMGPCLCENSADICDDLSPDERSSSSFKFTWPVIFGICCGFVSLIFVVVIYCKKQGSQIDGDNQPLVNSQEANHFEDAQPAEVGSREAPAVQVSPTEVQPEQVSPPEEQMQQHQDESLARA